MSTPDSAPARPMTPTLAGNLLREFADLTEGGIAPVEAAAVLKEGAESPAVAGLLGEIGQDLAREPSLARALERHAATFGPETVALVMAAERQGALAGVLAMLADDYERREHLAARLPVSLLWPLFLLGLLVLITTILMVFVIPSFKEVFTSFGADLPGPTLVLIAISDRVQQSWWILLALIIAVPVAVALLRRQPGPGMALDGAILKLPGVRRFLVRLLLARLVALLADAAKNRMPFAPVIAYLEGTLGNRFLRAMVTALRRDIEEGTPLSEAWRKHALLPPRIARLADIGERSGKLAPVLGRAARTCSAEAVGAVGVFRQGLFVTTYVLTGIIVGLTVIALYLPIFKLGSGL